MTKRMLIDSTNAEETRVVVLDGNRLDEFDVETSTKLQLKGNIYLAKVVRVEPSLQAAFVEYGGNRHGFLAFGEIHPDYYQIPVADRKRLLEAQEQEAREDEEAEERAAASQDRRRRAEPVADESNGGAATEAESEQTGVETIQSDMIESDVTGSDVTESDMIQSGAIDPAMMTASNDHPAEVETDAEVGLEMPNFDETGIIPMPADERVEVAQPAAIVADMIVAPEEASALFPDEPSGEMLSSEPSEMLAGEPSEMLAPARWLPMPSRTGRRRSSSAARTIPRRPTGGRRRASCVITRSKR